MLSCIKTGFYAKTPSGLFLYGDAFVLCHSERRAGEFNCSYEDETKPGLDHLLLRVCSVSVEEPDRVQIALKTWDRWFEEYAGNVVSPVPDYGVIWRPSSTLIAAPFAWEWLGYKGQEMT